MILYYGKGAKPVRRSRVRDTGGLASSKRTTAVGLGRIRKTQKQTLRKCMINDGNELERANRSGAKLSFRILGDEVGSNAVIPPHPGLLRKRYNAEDSFGDSNHARAARAPIKRDG